MPPPRTQTPTGLPPPSHPQEADASYRAFLSRSLQRCDAELAAVNQLNRSLHDAKARLLATYGEATLLDLGEGVLKLTPDGSKLQGEAGNADKEAACVDFLLRLKLRRKLLNRLARRLNRVSHAMDGEDLAPPGPPKYGDLRLHIDPDAVQEFCEYRKRVEQAKRRIQEAREDDNMVSAAWSQAEEDEHRKKYVSDDDDDDSEGDVLQDQKEAAASKGDQADTGAQSEGVKKEETAQPEGVSSAPSTTTSQEALAGEPKKTEQPKDVSSFLPDQLQPKTLEQSLREEDYALVAEYKDVYEKQVFLSTGVSRYTLPEVPEEDRDYAIIKYGAGIGAAHRSMSAREKEAEWRRWQTAVLARIPDQPTFEDLGMQHRVFLREKRRKRLLEDKEEETASPKKRRTKATNEDASKGDSKQSQEEEPSPKNKRTEETHEEVDSKKKKEEEDTGTAESSQEEETDMATDSQEETDDVRSEDDEKLSEADTKDDRAAESEDKMDESDDGDEEEDDKDEDYKEEDEKEEQEKKEEDEDEKASDKEKDDAEDDAKDTKEIIPKRLKPFSLAPVPGFYEQDLRRIRYIHADLLTTSIHEHARKRVAEVTSDYNKAFRASNEIYNRRSKLQSDLNNMLYRHRLEAGKKRNDYNLDVAIARARWQKRKDAWEVSMRARNSAAPPLPGPAPRTPPTAQSVVRRTVGEVVDRVVTRTAPPEVAIGTPITANAAARTDPLVSAVASSMANMVDAVVMRTESGWTGDTTAPMNETESFEEFVPPSVSDVMNTVADQSTGETLGQMHERLESALRKELTVLSAKLQSSEEERKRAWKKMLKTKSEFEVPHQLWQSSGGKRGRVQLDAAQMQLLPVPPLRASGVAAMPAVRTYEPSQPTVPAYVPPTVAARAMPAPAPYTPAVAGGASDSKYSAAKVKERIFADGSVIPVTMPKKNKDGLYQRPAGRTRKGMEWDAVRGRWIPADAGSRGDGGWD